MEISIGPVHYLSLSSSGKWQILRLSTAVDKDSKRKNAHIMSTLLELNKNCQNATESSNRYGFRIAEEKNISN